jgi:Protein of unknown function (DUF1559)
MEQLSLYDGINFFPGLSAAEWLIMNQQTAGAQSVSVFLCPSDPNTRRNPLGPNSYRACVGLGEEAQINANTLMYVDDGAFSWIDDGTSLRVLPLAAITDGLSNTLAFSEKPIGSGPGGVYSPFRDWINYPGYMYGILTPNQWMLACSRFVNITQQNLELDGGSSWMMSGAVYTLFYGSAPPNTRVPDCGTLAINKAAGRRFCDDHKLNSGKIVGHDTHYSDGTRCADVRYQEKDLERQQYVTIKRQYYNENMGDRMERPGPLCFLYVGREPLQKALPKAQYQGTDKDIGRECDVFLFSQVRWSFPQDHVFYLDKETSIPLKVASYRDQSARDKDQPLWVWTAESLDKVHNHYVPLKSREISYTETREPSYEWTFSVRSIDFNKDYADSVFWPTLEPGAGVLDTILSKGYEVPGGQKEPVVGSNISPGTTELIEAAPPSDWTAFAPTAMLALGCAILIAAGLAWWRRR